jgi:Domain of unknown function (DUF5047)
MLPGGLDLSYRGALVTSHQPYIQVDVLDGLRNVLFEDLTIEAGGVSATLTSRVSRQCTITVTEDLYPYEPTDLLAPYGNIIRAWRGIQFADGTRYRWIVFIGRIQEATLNADGTCIIDAADFATDVVDSKFVTPTNSFAGSMVTRQMLSLISEGFPLADFGTSDTSIVQIEPLTWQSDRGSALDELGTSISFFWYPLANGEFVLRRYPWTVFSAPVVVYADGASGSVTSSRAIRTREGVYNSLTVSGERLNGDPAVYALAQDTNPASATYVNGPFGLRHQLLRLQTPGTFGNAQGAARGNLRRLTSLTDTWSWEMTVDAALELGDVVLLNVRNRPPVTQVVASMYIPLDLSGNMAVEGRAQVIGVLEGVE